MGLFPELKSKKRMTVSEPKGMELMKGLAWTAVGVIGISFLTTSVSLVWKTIPALVGIIFCIVGGRQIYGYVLAYKAFKAFVPSWDAGRGMYDRFAQELNAWHQNDIVPTCCDGDTLYFLKLQKERLKKKGLKMTDQIIRERPGAACFINDRSDHACQRLGFWYSYTFTSIALVYDGYDI